MPVDPDARPAIGNKRVQTTGRERRERPGQFASHPVPNQVLFSSDGFPGRIYKLSLDGKVLGVFGKSGKQLGQFGWIHEIACPSENELYVAEILNWRVQKLVLNRVIKLGMALLALASRVRIFRSIPMPGTQLIELAPSILSADFAHLATQVQAAAEGGGERDPCGYHGRAFRSQHHDRTASGKVVAQDHRFAAGLPPDDRESGSVHS